MFFPRCRFDRPSSGFENNSSTKKRANNDIRYNPYQFVPSQVSTTTAAPHRVGAIQRINPCTKQAFVQDWCAFATVGRTLKFNSSDKTEFRHLIRLYSEFCYSVAVTFRVSELYLSPGVNKTCKPTKCQREKIINLFCTA